LKAIILAAGASRRLLPLTAVTPKCLIDINGKSLLDHQLSILKSFEIDDLVIVVGYKKEFIIEAIESNWNEMNVTFIENTDYDKTNTLHSLWLAKEHLLDDFLYFNADVLCHRDVVGRLLKSPYPSCLAIDIKNCGEEEVKILLDDNDRINSIGKDIDVSEATGEFIGIGKHGLIGNKRFVEILEREVNNDNSNMFFEFALNDMLKEFDFHMIDISDLPCIEIDFIEDLEEARNNIMPQIRG